LIDAKASLAKRIAFCRDLYGIQEILSSLTYLSTQLGCAPLAYLVCVTLVTLWLNIDESNATLWAVVTAAWLQPMFVPPLAGHCLC